MLKRCSTRSAAILALGLVAAGPASAITMPFGGGSEGRAAAPVAGGERPVILAQSPDAGVRVMQLEEEVRRLNGRVEELSFQLLQMQEQIRKTQEDNEFRFQELEQPGAAPADERTEAAEPPMTPETAAPPLSPEAAPGSTDREMAAVAPPAAPDADAAPAESDEIRVILDSGLEAPPPGADAAAPAAETPPPSSSTVAAITPNGATETYDLAYNYLLAGDYELAEQAFRAYSQTYPDAADTPDAKYWLGESLFAQQQYAEAAEVFLSAQKQHPESGKAAEMMLKLGMSLARLENRETACVTFREVAKRYPSISANVQRKLEAEQADANC